MIWIDGSHVIWMTKIGRSLEVINVSTEDLINKTSAISKIFEIGDL